jgi:hypothetical protein
MPVHKVETRYTNFSTASISIWPDSVAPKVMTAAIARAVMPANQRDNPILVAAKMTDLLQRQLDVRQLLTSLPLDDPDRTINPNRSNLFWDLTTLELVGRSVKVTVSWVNNRYELKLERTT